MLKTPVTIPKNTSTRNDLDFEYLKQIGIEYIESLGGGLWTDYNEHDPGITILEVLAYAVTDLANRINMPMQDLLVSADNSDLAAQFYRASEILSSEPVNASDYRKLFIDLDGVRNCWILPYTRMVYANCKEGTISYDPESVVGLPDHLVKTFSLKGLNRILVDFDLDDNLDPAQRQQLIDDISEAIHKRYHENRNLCEDLVEIKEVDKQCICVCAEIELEPTADEDEVHARILFAIRSYFSPTVRFYSLSEMLAKGYRTDEIFDGPFLENGFIDTAELATADLRSQVRLSDVMQLVANVAGVRLVKDISISGCDDELPLNEWLICLDPGVKPVLCDESKFSYKKDVLPISYDPLRVQEIYNELVAAEDAVNELAKADRQVNIPKGEYRDTNFYTTIQNDFPDTYGIGTSGLPGSVDTERKAQAKQLKAYLLFFDQVLASYFAHLGKVRDVLSVDNTLTETYFTQAVSDVSGLEDLVQNYPMNDNHQLTEHLMGQLDASVERRNQLLDHLLARFAENFSEYTFLMKELYGTVSSEMVLRSKQQFLREYVTLSAQRGEGFNYANQPASELWDTGNVSGAQKRIARLSGMKNYFRRDLSTNFMDVYAFNPSPGVTTYKWKVSDYASNELMVSVREHAVFGDAEKELYAALLKVIETPEDTVRQAFQAGVSDGQIIGNILISENAGVFRFEVIDPSILDPVDRVLGERDEDFATADLLETAILDTIEFVKFDLTEEGTYFVENILLRPDVFNDLAPAIQFFPICADDCEDCCSPDPYSFKISVILPGFTQRFSNPDFRLFMEELIQRELPAHVVPRICWIGYRKGAVPDDDNELLRFQTRFKAYLLAKTNLGQEQDEPTLVALKDQLLELNTIYPVGTLQDCEGGDAGSKIILGRTKLGTL